MDEKLILNDGTELDGHLIQADDRLFLYIHSISFENAFLLLSEPENVKTIRWQRYGEKGTVKGFKRLYSVTEESDTLVTAALKKG